MRLRTAYDVMLNLFKNAPIYTNAKGRITFKEIVDLVQSDTPVILEIGANDGTDTLEFCNAFPNGSIYCFEPDPRAANDWRGNVLKSNARLFEMAICSGNGFLDFHQSDLRAGGGEASMAFVGFHSPAEASFEKAPRHRVRKHHSG